jgi:DNA-binding beta-propeller fold protein YncE
LAAHDATGGHFFMGGWNRIVDVDLATGNRTLVCDLTTGTGPLAPMMQALSWDGTRLLAVDDRLDALVAIEPATGNRTYVSSYSLGSGPELLQPVTTAWDEDGQRIVVFDQIHGAVMGIAAADGTRALLSGPTLGSGPEPVGVEDLFVADGAALIAGYDGIIQVDLQTGSRQAITSGSVGTGPVVVAMSAVVADTTGQYLWALDRDDPRLYAVDPDSGNRSILSDNSTGTGPQIDTGLDLLFEADRILLLKAQALLSVDRFTGDRSYLSGGNVGAGPMLLGNWMSHAGPGRVIVGGPASVMVVDLTTGDRTDICAGGTSAGPMAWMEGLAVDDRERVWAADSELGALLAIDAVTCERVIASK